MSKIINESDFLKFNFKKYEKVVIKPIQLSTQIIMIHEIGECIDNMLDDSPKNIITAKYLYYNACEYLQNLLKEFFDINPYILDNNPNMFSENYEELKEYLDKTQLDGESFFDLINNDNSDNADINIKKFIYMRDLYIIGNLLKMIQE
jgi:uncharacterized protein with HEPN domain